MGSRLSRASGILGAVGLVLVLAGCLGEAGGTSETSAGASTPASRAPTGGNKILAESCVGVGYDDRWPELFAGGPTDGLVSLSAGPDAAIPGTRTSDDRFLFAKLLLIIDSRPGAEVRLTGSEQEGSTPVGFTHLGAGATLPNVEPGPASGWLPDRGQRKGQPADLPGYLVVTEPGCYLIDVEVDGQRFGPFAVAVLDGVSQ